MVKIIVDTNTIIAGMMGYKSPSRKILSLSLSKKIQLIGSSQTLAEFSEKVRLDRFQKYWQKYYCSSDKIIQDYLALVVMHEPRPDFLSKVIPIQDPKDAIFFQLALSTDTKIIVSNDHHLLDLKNYEGLKVVKPEVFIEGYEKAYLTQPLATFSAS